MNELGPNLIRTYVPVIVGGVIAWLATRGVKVNPATAAAVIVGMTSVITAAYYTAARVLEERFPSLGAVLLGYRPARHLGAAETIEDHEYDEHETWPAAELPEPGMFTPPSPLFTPKPAQETMAQQNLAALVAGLPPVQPGKARGPRTGQLPRYTPPPGR
jgi:hypothetical protein